LAFCTVLPSMICPGKIKNIPHADAAFVYVDCVCIVHHIYFPVFSTRTVTTASCYCRGCVDVDTSRIACLSTMMNCAFAPAQNRLSQRRCFATRSDRVLAPAVKASVGPQSSIDNARRRDVLIGVAGFSLLSSISIVPSAQAGYVALAQPQSPLHFTTIIALISGPPARSRFKKELKERKLTEADYVLSGKRALVVSRPRLVIIPCFSLCRRSWLEGR
jgi:hypothetical protein